MHFTQLEDFIKNIYKSISIRIPNEINMFEISNWLNIKLRFWDETSEAVRVGENHRIFLNELLTYQEQWQDFGHELCHVLQHTGYQRNIPVEFRLYQEVKANNFMYQFCVPTFMLLNYEISNYYNIKDGIHFITQTFNVTEEFAEERLNQFKRQIQQAKMDEEHRRYMNALYPKAPPYSEETNAVLNKLNMLIEKKKKGVV